MRSRTDEERLQLYRESLRHAWGFTDYNDWPVKLNAVFHLFLPEFGRELLADLHALRRERGFDPPAIARLFRNPARVYRLIDSTVYSMRRSGLSLTDQRAVVLELLSVVRAMKHGSEFNEDGRNLIVDPARAEARWGAALPAGRPVRSAAAAVHRLCGLLWAYTESIFFRAHDVTKEIHGPYPFGGDGGSVMVKEYLSLRPRGLWLGDGLLGAEEVVVILRYGPKVRIRIDALNHVYTEGSTLVDGLEAFAVSRDGRRLDEAGMADLARALERAIVIQAKAVDAMSWQEKVTKYAEIFWYRKAPLREARGLPWDLPDEVRRRCAAGTENPRRASRLSPEQVGRLAMLTI